MYTINVELFTVEEGRDLVMPSNHLLYIDTVIRFVSISAKFCIAPSRVTVGQNAHWGFLKVGILVNKCPV